MDATVTVAAATDPAPDDVGCYLRACGDRALLVRADLAPLLAPRSRLGVARRGGAIAAAATRLEAFAHPVVALASDDLEAGRALIDVLGRGASVRVAVAADDPSATPGGWEIEDEDLFMTRSTHGEARASLVSPVHDSAALAALYGEIGIRYWDPAMMTLGHYEGVEEGGALVSVSGVDFVLAEEGYAQIGNVATRPRARRRGLASACVRSTIASLAAAGVPRCGLFVDRRDADLVRLYERLGFGPRGIFYFLRRAEAEA